ncbi:Dcp1p-Dcp2p decapping enzyme complex alpha subunit [Geranomyces michiganensis]|nr:Dcp1p-Dcp2p decapping enzyme complex alpha subunit [Geranomyces michiganensis]
MASAHGSSQHPAAAPSAAASAAAAAAAAARPPPAAAGAAAKTQLPGKIGIPVQPEYANELRQLVQDTLNYRIDGFAGSMPVALTREHRQALEREDYYVCEKSDGVRYLMLLRITQSGPATFLIDRANDPHYIEKLHFPLPCPPGDNTVKFHADTLMDGELVVDVDGPHTTLTFLVFDFMLSNGVRLTHEPYNRRLGIFQRDVLAPYELHLKSNPDLKAVQPFRVAIKAQQRSYGLGRVFEDITKQKHGNDGLIFTSVNLPYTAGTCPQILKWKPPELSTVDFQIKVDYDRDRKPRYSTFIAHSGVHKFHDCLSLEPELSIQWKSASPDGRIGEFRWDPLWPTYVWDAGYVGTERRGGWRFVRFREDKNVANDITVLEDTKKAIENGVSRDMLLGWLENIRANWKHREHQATLPPRHPQDRKYSAIAAPTTPATEQPPVADSREGLSHRRKSSSSSSMSEFTAAIARKASADRNRMPENGAPTMTNIDMGANAAGSLAATSSDGPDRRQSVGVKSMGQSPATVGKLPGLTGSPSGEVAAVDATIEAPSRKKSLTEMMAHMPKGIRLKKAWPSAEPPVASLLVPQGAAILREEPSPLDEHTPASPASHQMAEPGVDHNSATPIVEMPPSPHSAERLPANSPLVSEEVASEPSGPGAAETQVKQEQATSQVKVAKGMESETADSLQPAGDLTTRPRRGSTKMDVDDVAESNPRSTGRRDPASPELSATISSSTRLSPDNLANNHTSNADMSTSPAISAVQPPSASQLERPSTPARSSKASESPIISSTQSNTPKRKHSRKTSSLHAQNSPQKSANVLKAPAKELPDHKRKGAATLGGNHRASDSPKKSVALTGRLPVDMTVDLPPPPVVLMTAPRPILGEDIYEDVEAADPLPSAPSTDRQPASIDATPSRKPESKKRVKSPRKKSIKSAATASAGVSSHRRTASTPYLPMSGNGGSISHEAADGRRPSIINQRRGSLHSVPTLVPLAPGLVALPPSETGPYIVGADGSPHYLAPSDPRNILMAGYVAYSTGAPIGIVPMQPASSPTEHPPSTYASYLFSARVSNWTWFAWAASVW